MESKKILVIGSSNTDMVVKSQHLPTPGETVIGGNFMMNPGGKGANQAVAAAKLGGDVTFIAKVGNDLFGEQAIRNFQACGIDTRFIIHDDNAASGVALIMVDARGENSISVALGANETLTSEDILPANSIIRDCSYLLMQLESPISLVEHIASMSREHDFRFVLNPAPAQPLSDQILQSLYVITPNAIEAAFLTDTQVEDEPSAREAAQVLVGKGVENVIITMGAKGAYILAEGLDEIIPCPRVDVVDTTAAGDTFNGALMVALAEGQGMRAAVQFANRAAAYSVGILGAQTSAPSRSDII